MQASPKENGTMFDTQKFVPTPGRSSPKFNFENVQWVTVDKINITVHNRICHTILFVFKINKIDKNLCQCELLCACVRCQAVFWHRNVVFNLKNFKHPCAKVNHSNSFPREGGSI